MKIVFLIALVAFSVLAAPAPGSRSYDGYSDVYPAEVQDPSLPALDPVEKREFLGWLAVIPLLGKMIFGGRNRQFALPPPERQFAEEPVNFLDDEVLNSPEESRRFLGWLVKMFKVVGKLFVKNADTAVSVAGGVASAAIQANPQPQPQPQQFYPDNQAARQFAEKADELVSFLDESQQSMSPEESRQFFGAIFGAIKNVLGVVAETVIGVNPFAG